jgi:hypothetical protein
VAEIKIITLKHDHFSLKIPPLTDMNKHKKPKRKQHCKIPLKGPGIKAKFYGNANLSFQRLFDA